jgi:hypothetical protein
VRAEPLLKVFLYLVASIAYVYWVFYGRFRRGEEGPRAQMLALSISSNFRRTRLERQRDSFRNWTAFVPWFIILAGIGPCLRFAAWLLDTLPPARFRVPNMNATQVLTEFTVFAVWSIVFFFIVKRLNERASRALQREIDELDSRS